MQTAFYNAIIFNKLNRMQKTAVSARYLQQAAVWYMLIVTGGMHLNRQ